MNDLPAAAEPVLKTDQMPRLSICVPTYQRPELLARAIASVVASGPGVAAGVELVVADNAPSDANKALVVRLCRDWSGRWSYHANEENLGMVGNWNRAVRLSAGEFVQVLHDDDYLLPHGLAAMVRKTQMANAAEMAFLFGVHTVDQDGRIRRRQEFEHDRCLPPPDALLALFMRPGFVRFPAMVLRRKAFDACDGFDTRVTALADYDLWTRVLRQWGLTVVAEATCAYVVHPLSETTRMFNADSIEGLDRLIQSIEPLVGQAGARACREHMLNRFVLAGACRALRQKRWVEARRIVALLRNPPLRDLHGGVKWTLLRTAFRLALLA